MFMKNRPGIWQFTLLLALCLGVIQIVATVLRPLIAANAAAAKTQALRELLPKIVQDASLTALAIAPLASNPHTTAKAQLRESLLALSNSCRHDFIHLLFVTSAQGYGGELQVQSYWIVSKPTTAQHELALDQAILKNLTLHRPHRETPGLGDQIEPPHSNWFDQFVNSSMLELGQNNAIDTMSGVTVTGNAVIRAVQLLATDIRIKLTRQQMQALWPIIDAQKSNPVQKRELRCVSSTYGSAEFANKTQSILTAQTLKFYAHS